MLQNCPKLSKFWENFANKFVLKSSVEESVYVITLGSCNRCLGCSRRSHGHPKQPLLESCKEIGKYACGGIITFTTPYMVCLSHSQLHAWYTCLSYSQFQILYAHHIHNSIYGVLIFHQNSTCVPLQLDLRQHSVTPRVPHCTFQVMITFSSCSSYFIFLRFLLKFPSLRIY